MQSPAAAYAAAIACLLLLCIPFLPGCMSVTPGFLQTDKSTMLGIEVGSSAPSAYRIRLGLIRHFSQAIPVSTNGPVFVPDYATDADGGVGLTRQNAKESFRTGRYVFDETLIQRTNR